MNDFSNKELQMINSFNYLHLVDKLVPMQLYRMMLEKAFCDDLIGPHVESLRRCYNALNGNGTKIIYRNTPEFNNLINI